MWIDSVDPCSIEGLRRLCQPPVRHDPTLLLYIGLFRNLTKVGRNDESDVQRRLELRWTNRAAL